MVSHTFSNQEQILNSILRFSYFHAIYFFLFELMLLQAFTCCDVMEMCVGIRNLCKVLSAKCIEL